MWSKKKETSTASTAVVPSGSYAQKRTNDLLKQRWDYEYTLLCKGMSK